MPPLYIVEQGARLRIEQRRLIAEKGGQRIVQVPLAHTNAVILFGNVSLTTPAMKRLMSSGVDVIFLTRDGRYEGRLVGPLSKFGLLRQRQYERIGDADFGLRVAQSIVNAKCLNARTLLSAKPGMLLVNVARGGLIDEPALAEALQDGRIVEDGTHRELIDLPTSLYGRMWRIQSEGSAA